MIGFELAVRRVIRHSPNIVEKGHDYGQSWVILAAIPMDIHPEKLVVSASNSNRTIPVPEWTPHPSRPSIDPEQGPMNSFELNKAFGAFLMALIFIMGTGMVTSFIFHAGTPEKPGYVIEVADASQEAAPEEVVETVDFATLLASADADKGAKVAKKCASCHTFDAGGANKTGPNLHGIVGRAVASIDGFKYSCL
jgi:cytochrome c553